MRKSRDYLMKCLGFVLLFGFISLGAIGGCNNNGGGQDGTRVLTENDLAEDGTIAHDPFGSIFVTFLEHPNRPDGDNQGTSNENGLVQTRILLAGTDQIPFNFNETTNHTFCYEDENNPDAEHTAILLNDIGQEVVQFEANGDCVELIVEAGEYILEITHDGKIEDIIPLFIISETIDNAAKNNHADTPLLKYAQDVKRIFLNKIKLFESTTAKAQTTIENNTQTLISTSNCPGCNLTGANLVNTALFQETADGTIIGADLSNAILTDADFSESILCQANLSGAIMDNTKFDGALWTTATCPNPPPCDFNLMAVQGSSTTAVTCDLSGSLNNFPISFLKTVCNKGSIGQCNLISDTTKMMLQAWGGSAGVGDEGFSAGFGGYAQMVTTLNDFITSQGSTDLYYYLGEKGKDGGNSEGGSGGASTAVANFVADPEGGFVGLGILAGGGGGSGSVGDQALNELFSSGCSGGDGGVAISTTSSQGRVAGIDGGFVNGGSCVGGGNGKGGGPSGLPGAGGSSSTDGGGHGGDGLEDFGGLGGPGGGTPNIAMWSNSTLEMSAGRGGVGGGGFNQSICTGCAGGGGGGGGAGGGGGGAENATLGAGNAFGGGGGGSFSNISTEGCSLAPTSRPQNPSSTCVEIRDDCPNPDAVGYVRIVFFLESDC